MMKYTLTCILFFIFRTGSSQDLVNERINTVENGLSKQTVLPAGTTASAKNLYDQMKLYKINGISIAVINNYTIEWAKAYGVADNKKNNPVTTETLFQCASIGKVITAMAALRLVRENRISLDENVNDKLTSWKIEENEFTSEEKVTLRRLLSHSAGLCDDYGFEGYGPTDKIPTLLQILNCESPANNKKKIKVEAIPGTTERYSGAGFVVIQQLIEDITHKAFSKYVIENVFDKLAMTNSTYDFFPDKNVNKPVARGHYSNGKIDKNREYNVYPEMGAAGPWTTAVDLGKLVIEIQKEFKGLSDLILDQKLCTDMLTPQINYKGLAVHLKGAEKPEAFWHAGNTAGYVALLYGIMDKGQGAVILTNSDAGEQLALETMTSVANAYDWPVMKNRFFEKLTLEEIKRYTGKYKANTGTLVNIDEYADGLSLMPLTTKKKFLLYKISDNEFIVKDSPDFTRIIFKKLNGTITEMTLTQNLGKIDTFRKVE